MSTIIKSTQVSHAGVSLDTVLDGLTGTPLASSTAYDPPSISAGASISQAFTLTGALLGDYVQYSFSQNLAGCALTAYVSAADQVTILIQNLTAGTVNLASGTLKLRLTRG